LGGVLWRQALALDPIEDLQNQINELSRAREQSITATKPLESELTRLQQRLNSITAGIAKAKDDLRALEASIAQREEEFSVQYALLSERVLSYYKASRAPATFLVLFTSGPSGNLARDLFYRGVVTDRDKDIIAQISQDLIQLEADKKKVEADRVRLADLQAKVDKEAEFFEGEIAGAKAYQSKLSQQIASLTQKQQSILGQRLSGLNLPQSLGAGPLYCTDDRTRDPGWSGFAFFTYGIPHRVGMNQYGALGRAKAGQTHEQILQASISMSKATAGCRSRPIFWEFTKCPVIGRRRRCRPKRLPPGLTRSLTPITAPVLFVLPKVAKCIKAVTRVVVGKKQSRPRPGKPWFPAANR